MGDSIAIKLGGDANDFVQTITAAYNAENTLVKSAQSVAQELEKQARGHDRASDSAKKQKDNTAGLNKEVSDTTKFMNGQISVIKSAITAWVGIEGIKKIYQQIREEIRQINHEQEKMGQAGLTMEKASKAVMHQVGGISMDQAKGRLTDIMKSGRLSSIGQAQGIAIAGNVAWGSLGSDKEQELVKTASEFIGRYGLGEEEGGALIEVLSKMGAKDQAGVKRISEQIFKSFRASPATSFSGWVMGLKKAAPEMMAAGATPEQVLGSMVQARVNKATEEQAAELNRQILMAMNKEKIQKTVAKEFGMNRRDWLGQGFDTRMMQFGQWVAKYGETPSGQELLGDVLESEAMGRTMAMFTPEGMTAIKGTKKELGGITEATYEQKKEEFEAMDVAGHEKTAAETVIQEYSADEKLKRGQRLIEKAEAVWSSIKAGQNVEGMTQEEQDRLKGRFWSAGETREKENVMQAMFEGRMGGLKELGLKGGHLRYDTKLGPSGAIGSQLLGTDDIGRQIVEAMNQYAGVGPGLWATGSRPEMVGKLDMMIERLDRMIEQQEQSNEKLTRTQTASSPYQ